MPTPVFGAFRSDTTLSNAGASTAVVGSTFEISAYSQIDIDTGVDPTIFAGDSVSNETANDPTQTYLGETIFWDFTVTVTDGTNTYEIGFFDYDIDGDGNSIGVDAEDAFFMGFIGGTVPPLNTTLTITAIIDNGPSIDIDTVVPCFTAGTLIETAEGPKPVETLCPGDAVMTLDNGPQVIRWIGSRQLDSIDLHAKPKLRPICIAQGALGGGFPKRDLRVSPQHRMLVRSPIAVRMFAKSEVLIPAIKLIDIPGVSIDEQTSAVSYFHILFDHHEIIFAEGAPCESLYLGSEARKAVGDASISEIAELFPELLAEDFSPETARLVPHKGREMRALVNRHVKNSKPILS
ncbi:MULTISPECIES: Hint domain-containing protein [unclassified Ruegeria]|uniref:Hint domain-containing protein n=1 Tax=unclassified Ruegeria TaxID=2625375 RepID=UPI001489AAA2|nr:MULTISPECIES: Hint domain-containing protein [unclassified Ruegeria]